MDEDCGRVFSLRKDNSKGQCLPISGKDLTFGGGLKADFRLRLPDKSLKDVHCLIRDGGGYPVLVNKSFLEPVILNGERVRKEAVLAHNDIFEVLGKKFQYVNPTMTDDKIKNVKQLPKRNIFPPIGNIQSRHSTTAIQLKNTERELSNIPLPMSMLKRVSKSASKIAVRSSPRLTQNFLYKNLSTEKLGTSRIPRVQCSVMNFENTAKESLGILPDIASLDCNLIDEKTTDNDILNLFERKSLDSEGSLALRTGKTDGELSETQEERERTSETPAVPDKCETVNSEKRKSKIPENFLEDETTSISIVSNTDSPSEALTGEELDLNRSNEKLKEISPCEEVVARRITRNSSSLLKSESRQLRSFSDSSINVEDNENINHLKTTSTSTSQLLKKAMVLSPINFKIFSTWSPNQCAVNEIQAASEKSDTPTRHSAEKENTYVTPSSRAIDKTQHETDVDIFNSTPMHTPANGNPFNISLAVPSVGKNVVSSTKKKSFRTVRRSDADNCPIDLVAEISSENLEYHNVVRRSRRLQHKDSIKMFSSKYSEEDNDLENKENSHLAANKSFDGTYKTSNESLSGFLDVEKTPSCSLKYSLRYEKSDNSLTNEKSSTNLGGQKRQSKSIHSSSKKKKIYGAANEETDSSIEASDVCVNMMAQSSSYAESTHCSSFVFTRNSPNRYNVEQLAERTPEVTSARKLSLSGVESILDTPERNKTDYIETNGQGDVIVDSTQQAKISDKITADVASVKTPDSSLVANLEISPSGNNFNPILHKKSLTNLTKTRKAAPKERRRTTGNSALKEQFVAHGTPDESKLSRRRSNRFSKNGRPDFGSYVSESAIRTSLRPKKKQSLPLNESMELRGVRELLITPKVTKKSNDSLKLTGIKRLLKTPKAQKEPNNDLTDVRGLKKLLATPKVVKSPKNDLTQITGVKKLLKTPKPQKSPKNDLRDVRVKSLFLSPQKSPNNDLTDVRGVKKLLQTPKPVISPELQGMKKLFQTVKTQKEPKNDLRDVKGVKGLFRPNRPHKAHSDDLTDVRGVKGLFSTPNKTKSPVNDLNNIVSFKQLWAAPAVHKSPLNDLSDVKGLERLVMTPKDRKSPKNDLLNVSGVQRLFSEDPFDSLVNKKPIITYHRKSSPVKSNSILSVKSDDEESINLDTCKWVEQQNVNKYSNDNCRQLRSKVVPKDNTVEKNVKTRSSNNKRKRQESESKDTDLIVESLQELPKVTTRGRKRRNLVPATSAKVLEPTEDVKKPQADETKTNLRKTRGQLKIEIKSQTSLEEKSPKTRGKRSNKKKPDTKEVFQIPDSESNVNKEKKSSRKKADKVSESPKSLDNDSLVNGVRRSKRNVKKPSMYPQ